MRNSKIRKLKDELAKAREKSAEWQGRVRELERKITEQENLEILQAVRGVASTPEALQNLQIFLLGDLPFKFPHTALPFCGLFTGPGKLIFQLADFVACHGDSSNPGRRPNPQKCAVQ